MNKITKIDYQEAGEEIDDVINEIITFKKGKNPRGLLEAFILLQNGAIYWVMSNGGFYCSHKNFMDNMITHLLLLDEDCLGYLARTRDKFLREAKEDQ